MSMVAELVEVVIGVDTYPATYAAAVLEVRTGGVLARQPCPAIATARPDGLSWPSGTPGCGHGR